MWFQIPREYQLPPTDQKTEFRAVRNASLVTLLLMGGLKLSNKPEKQFPSFQPTKVESVRLIPVYTSTNNLPKTPPKKKDYLLEGGKE